MLHKDDLLYRAPVTRRPYVSDDDVRAIYTSTETYADLQEKFEVSLDVVRDIRCGRGRFGPLVDGLTRGKTHGRNGHHKF